MVSNKTHKKKRNKQNRKIRRVVLSQQQVILVGSDSEQGSVVVEAETLETIDPSLVSVFNRFTQKATSQSSAPVSQWPQFVPDSPDSEASPVRASRPAPVSQLTLADLKSTSARPDLIEAIDLTAVDPLFLAELKGWPLAVPVPRHWSSKRKYLANRRSVDRVPYRLPDFIETTGIAKIRADLLRQEAEKSAKQLAKQKLRPKTAKFDLDFRVMYDAFFKFATKPGNLTQHGNIYYEGKEQEDRFIAYKPGNISPKLREALNILSSDHPPPWLPLMQRFGPPPAYPNLPIPGVNAPIPFGCSYGFQLGGWGQPPLDPFGNPIFKFAEFPQIPIAAGQATGGWAELPAEQGTTSPPAARVPPAHPKAAAAPSTPLAPPQQAPAVLPPPAAAAPPSDRPLYEVLGERKVEADRAKALQSALLVGNKVYDLPVKPTVSIDEVREALKKDADQPPAKKKKTASFKF